MKAAVCEAILKAPPQEGKLTTPILAMTRAARMHFDDVIDPQIPIKALKLLNYLMKEAVDTNQRLSDYIPYEHLVQIVEQNVKTTIDTACDKVTQQCERIVEGLRLAEVLASDEDVRSEILQMISSQLCAHVAECQLITNPIVLHMSKAPAQRTDTISEWSMHGVSIVLELLRLLAALKDFSKTHKDQYWKFLKDERLISFLAYAIAHGSHQMVYDALILYTHCSQVQAFPSRWLGDLIASCSLTKRRSGAVSLNNSREFRKSSDLDASNGDRLRTPECPRTGDTPIDSVNVDELLERLRKGLDIRDVKMSEMLGAYETKMTLMQRRERELQALITAKDAALVQSERLRIQFRNGQGSSESDLSHIRGLVAEQERLNGEITKLRDEVLNIRREKETVLEENKKEREMSAQMREDKEDFRTKLELASKAVLDKQELCTLLIREKQTLQDELKLVNEQHSLVVNRLDGEILEIRRQLAETQKREVDSERRAREYREKIESEMEERSRLQEEFRRSVECEKALREKEHHEYKETAEAELKKLRDKLNMASSEGDKAKQDLERMKRLKEEMLKLAGGF